MFHFLQKNVEKIIIFIIIFVILFNTPKEQKIYTVEVINLSQTTIIKDVTKDDIYKVISDYSSVLINDKSSRIILYKSDTDYIEIISKNSINYTLSIYWWSHSQLHRKVDDITEQTAKNMLEPL